ncbi:unnamed protein product [Closterium sp. NIES-54]
MPCCPASACAPLPCARTCLAAPCPCAPRCPAPMRPYPALRALLRECYYRPLLREVLPPAAAALGAVTLGATTCCCPRCCRAVPLGAAACCCHPRALQRATLSRSSRRLALSAAVTAFASAAFATATIATGTVTDAMATPTVLALDAEGRSLGFESWLEDFHQYLQSVTQDIATSRVSLRTTPPCSNTRCLALPLTFPALSDLATVANEGGRSGDGRSGGGGQQELEPLCVAACAPSSTGAVPAEALLSVPVTLADPTSELVYAHPSTVLSCLVVPSDSSGSIDGVTLLLLTQRPLAARHAWRHLQGSGSGGADSGGARSPRIGGVGGTGVGGAGSGDEPVNMSLPPPSSLPAIPDPVSDLARATSPTVPRSLAALVSAHASSTATASSFVAELAGFAATCRRAYLAGLVSASSCPLSVGGELSLGCDVLEDIQFKLEYQQYPLSIQTHYVAPGRHHPAHWRATRRVLRYLAGLASRT